MPAMNRIELIHNQLKCTPRTDEDATPSPWTQPVGVEELRKAFETDNVFREFFATSSDLQQKQIEQWLVDLTEVINGRMATAPSTMKGCELMFRFRKAYGDVHHMALATVWRGGNRDLQMRFAHHESLLRGKRYVGLVANTFDVRRWSNGETPPALKSMEKEGLPDVQARPCPHPKNLELASWLFREDCVHPYGSDGREDKNGYLALTCFSITNAFHRAVHGEETGIDARPTVPDGVEEAMTTFFGEGRFEPYRYFTRDGQTYDTKNLQAKDHIKGFKHQGTQWGNHENWNVCGTPSIRKTRSIERAPTATLRPKF